MPFMRASKIEGVRFGRLLVIRRVPSRPGEKASRWLCRCDCGIEKTTQAIELNAGKVRSCGCLQRENQGNRARTHGRYGTPEYFAWQGIKYRCYNPRAKAFKNYGARGIRMCDEWLNDFPAFLTHVGPRPSPDHSIDRIDNDGHYEPGNMRWATWEEQNLNRRGYGKQRPH